MPRADPLEANDATGGTQPPDPSTAWVEDFMHQGVISVSPDTPLREVARILASRHIHCVALPALQPGARSKWASLSALDLVRAAADPNRPRRFGEMVAADIAMAEGPIVSTADHLDSAMRVMARAQVEHILVVRAEDGRPAGILSTLDIAGAIAGIQAPSPGSSGL